ncbi:Uncharacterized protein SCF082_LOCUS20479 [Durusdinium trenchii]|uniref:Uncharacterized protein n=1 Tax=Durusdinium trenchii TaxID=1381693 RepID=A0ABP0L2P0_9DINO
MDPTPATAAEQTAPSGAGNAPAVLKVDPASQYRKNATLSEIFGPHVQPGRELLDVITKTYKAERETVLAAYTKSVQQKGVIRGVRGECWVQAPNQETGEVSYGALTFATLSEAFYKAFESADCEDYPNLMLTAKYGLDVLVFDARTPDSVLQFLNFASNWITYHNAFHQGAQTSFMEMILKVERAWGNFKLAHGISTRQSDYETKYRQLLESQFPATWTSFRHYEATRAVYNIVSKSGCLAELKAQVSDHCDFLSNELAHDSVIFCMKEILSALPAVFNIMSEPEKQAILLEAAYLCVTWMCVVRIPIY